MCNNALFSRRNMGAMKATPKHPSMRRMYEAARRLGKLDENELASMARLLNQSAQCVNNWGRRGPSKQARLQFQRDFGVSATWVETGDGEMLIAQPQAQKQPPTVREPDQPHQFGNGRQRRMEQLMGAADELDEFGLVALIERAKDLAKEYPKRKQQAS